MVMQVVRPNSIDESITYNRTITRRPWCKCANTILAARLEYISLCSLHPIREPIDHIALSISLLTSDQGYG